MQACDTRTHTRTHAHTHTHTHTHTHPHPPQYGNLTKPWADLLPDTSHLSAVNQAFNSLSSLIGRDRIIVIGTFRTYLKFLEGAAGTGFPPFHGRFDCETSKVKWGEQLEAYRVEYKDIIQHCDYDGAHVNPSTIIDVISGRQPHFPTLVKGRVVPCAPPPLHPLLICNTLLPPPSLVTPPPPHSYTHGVRPLFLYSTLAAPLLHPCCTLA